MSEKKVTKKTWHSANDIIEQNSLEETRIELYGKGYLAKLFKRIDEVNAAIKAEDDARKARREARQRASGRKAASEKEA